MLELLNSDSFLYGAWVGGLFVAAMAVWSMSSRSQTLLACARQGTAEKLIDGRFYYLVHESEYNQMSLAWLNEKKKQNEPEPRIIVGP